jgi:hypothetical protein
MRTRTMIYLDEDQHRALRREAEAEGVSMTELIRRLVRRHLAEQPSPPAVPPETYLRLVGIGSSGRRDVSERHDAYLGDAVRREHSR